MATDVALSAAPPSISQHADLTLSDDLHDGSGATQAGAKVSAATTIGNSGTLFANPTIKLSPDLGIVVIQFHNAEGAVTSQIPSQRVLEAYLSGAAKLPHDSGSSVPAPAAGDAV